MPFIHIYLGDREILLTVGYKRTNSKGVVDFFTTIYFRGDAKWKRIKN